MSLERTGNCRDLGTDLTESSRKGIQMFQLRKYTPTCDVIQVHQNRVCPCPTGFPAGYYWYGPKQKGPGHPPKWIEMLF